MLNVAILSTGASLLAMSGYLSQSNGPIPTLTYSVLLGVFVLWITKDLSGQMREMRKIMENLAEAVRMNSRASEEVCRRLEKLEDQKNGK